MTFSAVARCADTGMFGVIISSSSPAVAARCAFARAGVGAVATQNVTDPALGPRGLDLMEAGSTAPEAVEILRRSAPHIEYRQILAIDDRGRTGVFSGSEALGIWGEAQAADVACGGNLLANETVPQTMAQRFAAAPGHLGDRLVAAMRAAIDAGGEAGPVHSAGMVLVRDVAWPVADLRVDWSEDCPVEALAGLWTIYRPQLDDYVARALDPRMAPVYGVPGDP